MVHADYLISQPHRVLWAGFETRTTWLQHAGWKISCEQDPMQDAIRLALRHDDLNMTAITDSISYYQLMSATRLETRFIAVSPEENPYILTFRILAMYPGIMIHHRDEAYLASNWFAVDAQTQFARERVDSLEDLAVFAEAPLTRTKALIVDPNDVNDLMSRIIDLQRPEQDVLRAKARMRESREGMLLDEVAKPRQIFHAQILSLAA
jgi:hypothetical protein